MERDARTLAEFVAAMDVDPTLSRPFGYWDVLRYFLGRFTPGLVGPAVVLVAQVVLNGVQGLVLFGGGTALFVLAALAGAARVKARPLHLGLLAVSWLAVAAAMYRWTAAGGDAGVAAWVVLLFGFTSVVAAGAATIELRREVE